MGLWIREYLGLTKQGFVGPDPQVTCHWKFPLYVEINAHGGTTSKAERRCGGDGSGNSLWNHLPSKELFISVL